MAEKEHEEKEAGGEEKKKSSNLVLIIIIVVLVLILAIGGVIAAMMMGNHDAEAQSGSHKEASAHDDKGGEEEHAGEEGDSHGGDSHGSASTEVGIMYPLDTFTVNLLSESGRRYLKCELNLEIEGEELALELDAKKPLLRDIIIRLLTSKSLEEISTAKGKEKLKEQIVGEINTRIKDGKIKNVYFTDFVIQ